MKLKTMLTILILFMIYFIFYSISYSHSISKDLENQLFRLHILANSDSSEDQQIKLHVRNKIISYLNTFSFKNKQELINYLTHNKSQIQKIVQTAIEEKGYSYDVSIEIGNAFYPQKRYKNVILPSGHYDGLRIKIGKAEGHNWWCVLFPPMCLIDQSTCELPKESELILQNNLTAEATSVITQNTTPYKFKFKIIDFINNL